MTVEAIVIPIEGTDRELGATWYEANPDVQSRGSILNLCALAVPQGSYRHVARWLAQRGWNVLTFDYSGTGASTNHKLTDRHISADDWTQQDLPAALAALKARVGTSSPVVVMTHSVGGQLLGQSPIAAHVDGALMIGSQRGQPRFFSGPTKRWLRTGLAIIPLLNATLGYVPAMKGGLPENLPGPAANQWAKWCRTGTFTDLRGRSVEDRFTNLKAPLVAIHISDDPMAPAASVDALAAVYSEADVTRATLDPAELGLKRIGHFGWMNPTIGEAVWPELEAHLECIATGSRRIQA